MQVGQTQYRLREITMTIQQAIGWLLFVLLAVFLVHIFFNPHRDAATNKWTYQLPTFERRDAPPVVVDRKVEDGKAVITIEKKPAGPATPAADTPPAGTKVRNGMLTSLGQGNCPAGNYQVKETKPGHTITCFPNTLR